MSSNGRIKKALIIQQVPHEGPGIIGEVLLKMSIEIETIRPYLNSGGTPRCVAVPRGVENHTALVIMGGPMGAYDEAAFPFLRDELRLIERCLRDGVPVLGVCLGAQLMARAAGARVYKGESKEIGWYDLEFTDEGRRDRLFSGLPSLYGGYKDKLKVFQWHGDTFDVPRGSSLLATSENFPNQCVRLGRRAYALQFHLEVTGAMVESWLREEGNVSEIREYNDSGGTVDPEQILRQTPQNSSALRGVGRAVFSSFFGTS